MRLDAAQILRRPLHAVRIRKARAGQRRELESIGEDAVEVVQILVEVRTQPPQRLGADCESEKPDLPSEVAEGRAAESAAAGLLQSASARMGDRPDDDPDRDPEAPGVVRIEQRGLERIRRAQGRLAEPVPDHEADRDDEDGNHCPAGVDPDSSEHAEVLRRRFFPVRFPRGDALSSIALSSDSLSLRSILRNVRADRSEGLHSRRMVEDCRRWSSAWRQQHRRAGPYGARSTPARASATVWTSSRTAWRCSARSVRPTSARSATGAGRRWRHVTTTAASRVVR